MFSMDASVDIRRLQRMFDRRASSFNEVAFLPRQIAQQMRARLDYIKLTPTRVLDVGCGPGADLVALQSRFKNAAMIGLDISARMISSAVNTTATEQFSKGWRRLPDALRTAFRTRAKPTIVQADFMTLPFALNTFDLLWSNLALHWHTAFDRLFAEWSRVLKVGGLLMLSTLGPDSLRELRLAWQTADGSATRAHIIDFLDMHDIGDILLRSGFEAPVMDREVLTITYRSAQALLNDVRRWGGYPLKAKNRPLGLTGCDTYKALISALNAQRRSDNTLPLSIEIIYGHAWKTGTKKTSEAHGKGYSIVRVDEIKKPSAIHHPQAFHCNALAK